MSNKVSYYTKWVRTLWTGRIMWVELSPVRIDIVITPSTNHEREFFYSWRVIGQNLDCTEDLELQGTYASF